MRLMNGTLMDPIHVLDYDRKECHRLQLKTMEGSVCAVEHEKLLDNRCGPFENPYPDLRCFPKSQVEVLETISSTVLRVQIQGEEYCLKAGSSDLMDAVEKLHAIPHHPNVLSLSGAVVDAKGNIIGMLTPFVSGFLLQDISSATKARKTKWKAKSLDAMNFLHNANIVWGDAKPDNIIISCVNDEPVLIDFEGGQTNGWVDENLCDTMEGDLQALPRILKFMDNIPGSAA